MPKPVASRGDRSLQQDLGFVAVIFLSSSALYVGQLGFYSDDWSSLAAWTSCADQSYVGLVRCFYSRRGDVSVRPLQILYQTALYRWFGSHPFGQHAINGALIVCTLLLLYLALSKFRVSRTARLAIVLVYGLMPHYSADRFWIAAAQAHVCMAFCFLSFYSAARILPAGSKQRWAWTIASVLAMLASLLAYEVAAPLLVLVPVLLYLGFRHNARVGPSLAARSKTSKLIPALSLGSLVLFVLLKVSLQSRMGFQGKFLHQLGLVFRHAILQAFNFNIGRYGLGLPAVAWQVVHRHFDIYVVLLAALAGVTIFAYCFRAAKETGDNPRSRTENARLMLLGLVCYGLGFAPSAADVTLDFVSTGVANRVTIAAALGTAIWLVGLFGWVSSFLPGPPRMQAAAYTVLVAVYCASGFAMNDTLGSYWIEARRQQEHLLTEITGTFAEFPPRTTLLVGGVCRYVGPGVVFETEWDTTGALQIVYRDPTLRANVLNPRQRLQPDSIMLPIYSDEKVYPYGDRLILYDIIQKRIFRLTNLEAAKNSIRSATLPEAGCSPGTEGNGAPVF